MDAWFWSQTFRQFIFVLAQHGHVVFLGTLAILSVSFGPIGRALAARLRAARREAPDDALAAAGAEALQAELAELRERLDFSERVLTEVRHLLREGAPRAAVAPAPVEEPTPV